MRTFSWGVALVVLMFAGNLRADDTEESFIEKGLRLRREHRDEDALEQFRRAAAIRSSPRTRAQIALAEQALGRWVAAEQDLLAALAANDDRWIVEHKDTLARAIEVVRRHLGTVTLTSNVEGAEVFLNGTTIGRTPLAHLRAVAGNLRFDIRHEGYDSASLSIALAAGAEVAEHVDLVLKNAFVPEAQPSRRPETPPSAPVAPEVRPLVSGDTRRSLAWGSFWAAGAVLGGAAVAQIFNVRDAAVYNDDSECLRPPLSRDQRCGAYRGSAETAQNLANIGYVAAGTLGLASAVLFLTSASSSRIGPSSQPGRTPTAWIDARPDGMTVGWYGHF